MSEGAVTTTIDPDRCTGCGSCVEVCPSDTIELRGGKAVVTGTRSMGCGHCAAVCPEDAISVGVLDPEASRFSTFTAEAAWLPHGAFDEVALVRLMSSRRSCRNFEHAAVDLDALTDLAKIGATAPSGTNSQRWRFALLPDRAAVEAFSDRVAAFYTLLNRLVERPPLRLVGRFLGMGELERYHAEHYERVKEALAERARGGRERLFHGAPAAILVSSLRGAATPREDAMLASQNILLAAHAMGLGTCLVGYAVAAIEADPRIRWWLALDRGEVVNAVIAVGYPSEVYERVAGRRTVPIRLVMA